MAKKTETPVPEVDMLPDRIDDVEALPDYFQATSAVAVRMDQLKSVRPLTMEATSISRLGAVVCQTLSELRMDLMPGFDAVRTPVKTPTVDITDVQTGESYTLICNALLASAFQRAGEPLAGRYFAIRSGDIVAGKRYRQVEVVELERV